MHLLNVRRYLSYLLFRGFLTMQVSALKLLAVCLPAVHGYYVEQIVGQGLIGSHFGIPFFNATFDYVVVGGGTAGLTIATRLAENTSYSVAVIEAGGFPEMDDGNLSSIPAFNSYWVGKDPAIRNPLIDWGVHTTPIQVRTPNDSMLVVVSFSLTFLR